MGVQSLWIRLNVDRGRAYFLRGQSKLLAAAWDDLLCHVKTYAPKIGRVRFTSAEDLADDLRFPEDEAWAVARLIDLASAAGPDGDAALSIEDGHLVVVGWQEYQSPGAERMRKTRVGEGATVVTNEVCDVLCALCAQNGTRAECAHSAHACHATQTQTRRQTEASSKPNEEPEPLRGDSDLDFWGMAAKHPDKVVRALCKTAFHVDKFKAVVPRKMTLVEAVIGRIRAHAPSDEAVMEQIGRFGTYYGSQRHIAGRGQWWITFENWCGKRYGAWALAKPSSGGQKRTYTEDELARLTQ